MVEVSRTASIFDTAFGEVGGLNQQFAKLHWVNWYRGFESPPLRSQAVFRKENGFVVLSREIFPSRSMHDRRKSCIHPDHYLPTGLGAAFSARC